MFLLTLACSTPPVPTRVRGTPDPRDPAPETSVSTRAVCDPVYPGPGDRWYTYEDRGCLRGNSSSSVQVLPEDGQSGLSCAIAWSGTLGAGQVHPFAGVSSDLAQHALQGFQKIVLSVRGDGGPVRLRLPTTAAHLGAHRNADQCTTDEDAYGFVFACGDGSAQWKTVEIPFDRLKQSGWGQVWTFDAADVSALQLQTERQKPGSFHCDFRLLRLEP